MPDRLRQPISTELGLHDRECRGRSLRFLRYRLTWHPFAVLCYHEVSEAPVKWAVTPGAFAAHLEWLRTLGCHLVSMAQVSTLFRDGTPLPPRAVCLHFDDARAGFGDFALPALRRAGAPAALYVVPGWVDGRAQIPERERYGGIMTWEQIRAATADPLVEVGCHGDTHRNLKRVAPSVLSREIGDARKRLEDTLEETVIHFAPPYNRVNRRVRRAVCQAGFQTLSAGGGGVNGRLASPFRIQRILVSSGFRREDFAQIADRLGGRAVAKRAGRA